VSDALNFRLGHRSPFNSAIFDKTARLITGQKKALLMNQKKRYVRKIAFNKFLITPVHM